MAMRNIYSWVLGTTCFVYGLDISRNLDFLANQVEDIELIWYDLKNGPSNLPTPALIDKLITVKNQHNLSYTIHLPLDIKQDPAQPTDISLLLAKKVISFSLALEPAAYVFHLESRMLSDCFENSNYDRLFFAIEKLLSFSMTSPELFSLENLEFSPLFYYTPVYEKFPISRCIDIGHLWKDGSDPLPILQEYLHQTKVIHLHGVQDGQDHISLDTVASSQLVPVVDYLKANYAGVLTLEVFSEPDFLTSKNLLI
jgi:hypothetical protein